MFEGTCAHCAKHTHFTARTAYIRTANEEVGLDGRWAYPITVEVSATCDNCKRFNTCVGNYLPSSPQELGHVPSSDAARRFGDHMTDRKWSPPPLLPVDTSFLPKGVAGYLQEAHNAMSIGAHRGVLLLVRSTIEAAAKDKGIESGSLVQKINKLHDEGHVRSGTKDMAHVLRILGNDMAHGDIDAVPSEEDAHDSLTLARFVLDDVYVADARRADMMARRSRPDDTTTETA